LFIGRERWDGGTALYSDGQPASPVPGSQWLMMHDGHSVLLFAQAIVAMHEPLHTIVCFRSTFDVALLNLTRVACDFFMSQPTMRVAIITVCTVCLNFRK